MHDCPFCAIVARESEAEIVLEDELALAFLDLHPIRPGHTQIVPRVHLPYFEDLPEPVASRILGIGQRVALALKALFPVPRVAFLFTGGDIAHAHAHLVPMHEKTDITSALYIAERPLTFGSTPRAPAPELARVGSRLRRTLRALPRAPRSASSGERR